jgi:hypothetical protein
LSSQRRGAGRSKATDFSLIWRRAESPPAPAGIRWFAHREIIDELVNQGQAGHGQGRQSPPRKPGERPWWSEHYSDERKVRDRELIP